MMSRSASFFSAYLEIHSVDEVRDISDLPSSSSRRSAKMKAVSCALLVAEKHQCHPCHGNFQKIFH
jgi:hypothetical protein